MTDPEEHTKCPACGTAVPADANTCPNCGEPIVRRKWYSLKGLNAAEIFLLILGFFMLLVGLVAV